MPLPKNRFVLRAIILTCLGFLASHLVWTTTKAESQETLVPEPAALTITDDEINGFLFRISEGIRSKVMTLKSEPVERLPLPFLFEVSVGDMKDTWGETRPDGRVHTGTDIIVPLGELIVSPTDAVVTKIGYDNRGGNFVVTANPGGEQFYFAHLDRVAEHLSVGDTLKPGDPIGYVGNTGNARGKSPHLHLGIYYKGLDINPFPRLVREFSFEERTAALEQILATEKIMFGANNDGIRFLQRFLIGKDIGLSSEALARAGATGYFGLLTKNALAEYQHAAGIRPASGYFGPITRASMRMLGIH
ncbi:MAG: peptidoglycan DD-metalloendopeptidase family protein [Patescibacteria group bacterium]